MGGLKALPFYRNFRAKICAQFLSQNSNANFVTNCISLSLYKRLKNVSIAICNIHSFQLNCYTIMPRHRARPRSFHAGLKFPVGRVHRRMKKGPYAKRIANGVPVYMTAVLEHITGELLKTIGDVTQNENMKRLSPFHIRTAVHDDEELKKLFSRVSLAEVCLLPAVNSEDESEDEYYDYDEEEEDEENSLSGEAAEAQ